MATLDQIIKDLQEIADSGGVSGNSAARRKAAEESKKALESARKQNKLDNDLNKKKIEELRLAQKLLKSDSETYKLIEKEIKQTEEQIKQNEKMLDIAKKVSQSFVGLGKAAFEGSGSISAFTDNVKGLGLLGNRLDVNIETFRQLSQSGANFGKSIVDLRLAAADAALPLDDFASLVANNSNNLAALFGSTTQGAKQIAQLGKITREVGLDRLAPLGFTIDEINETLLLNLDFQRRTGVLNQLTDRQRIDSAIAFAEELDRLAKLTGAQRDELRKAIESQKSNERFQVALQGMTEETRQRLQGFASAVETASPALAEGIQDLIATGGVPITEAAMELTQNIPQVRRVIEALNAGTLNSSEALEAFAALVPGSVERFSKATVTGTVGFTRLQGPLLEFRDRVLDVNGVVDEQNMKTTKLVQGLTTFEQASKVLASQFQGIETSLLQSFGPALGGLINGIQGMMGAFGGIANILARSPALTGTAIAGILAGKYLFSKVAQIGIVAAGTRMGTAHLMGGSMMGTLGKGARVAGGMAGRVLPGLGAAIGVGSSLSMMASDDEETRKKGKYGLGGAAAGALAGAALGSVIPGLGTVVGGLIGAGLGSMGGQFAGGMQFGGGMDAGKTYLTGERGPELITAGTNSAVTSNNDLQKIFDTSALEAKMNSMLTALNTTNTSLTNMANGVNTLVAVESRALKAVETSARRDRNQVGLV
jgi:hypothetical protein